MTQVLGRADEFLWHWRNCQERQMELKASWPREEPVHPTTGEGWYDEISDCLYVWDGVEWICVPND
jgi:hypothetical protein